MSPLIVQAVYNGPKKIRNTDARAARELMRVQEFDSRVAFRAMPALPFYLSGVNFASKRILKRYLLQSIPMTVNPEEAGCIYQYGGAGLRPRSAGSKKVPLVKTDGYPMIREALDRPESELKALADDLARRHDHVSCLHFHTEVSRDNFLRYRPDWRERTAVVPLFTPHLELVDEAFVERKFSQTPLQIAFVGWQGIRKGIEDLSSALDQIADFLDKEGVQATIVSQDKPSCTRFKNINYTEGLPRSDVLKLMRESHLFVLPTRRETFGLVFIEAMGQGCVCVGDDDYPRHEIFGEDAGIMIPPRNPALLADSLMELLVDPKRLETIARSGLQRVSERYAPAVVAKQYADLFIRVASTA